MPTVSLNKMIEKLDLKNLTPDIATDGIEISSPDINRPALQLAGYFEHFACERVQIIGYVEYTYLKNQDKEEKLKNYERFMSSKIPCVIYASRTEPDEEMYEMARKYHKPLLFSNRMTSPLMAEVIRWLNVELAPCISIHGVLVDVYGEGILIMGESGIGIIDVKTLYGVESVKETQNIDLVIRLEEWDKDREYDRLGLNEEYTEFLGNKVVCHSIPIRPGRNLAIIVESAAVNHRQKKMGYNAAQELYRRVQESINRNKK